MNKYNKLVESAIQNMNNSIHDKSISEFLKIIKNYPDDIKAYNYLAMIYRKNNDIDSAIDILKQAHLFSFEYLMILHFENDLV